MRRQPRAKAGLQAERTQLSWERTSIGFLVSGALVLLRQPGPFGVGRTILALAAVLLALVVVWLGHLRGQRIRRTRLIAGKCVVASPRTEVLLIGSGTAGFAMTIIVALAIST